MEKLIMIIVMALVGCGQEKSAKRVNPETTRAIISMAAAEQEKSPEVSASPTPAVIIITKPDSDQDQSQDDTEQTDQIPEVSIIDKSPAQNVSQNDCTPKSKIPCVS